MAGWGTALLAAAASFASGDVELTRAFIIATMIASFAVAAYILYAGWQEGGIIEAVWQYRYPLHLLTNASGRRLAAFWLLIVAGLLSGVLLLTAPEAWPLKRHPAHPATHASP